MNDDEKSDRQKLAEDELSILWENRRTLETADDLAAAALDSQKDHFWPFILELAELCDSILERNGFPKAAQSVRHDGNGNWWSHPADAPSHPQKGETWKITLGKNIAQEYAPDFSDVWYAGQVGLECRLAHAHFRKGDAGEPFLLSRVFQIATWRSEWNWRRRFKPAIITGRKQRKVLNEHRQKSHATNQSKMNKRQTIIAELKKDTKLTGGALEKYLKHHLFSMHGIQAEPRTIRRDLASLRKAR